MLPRGLTALVVSLLMASSCVRLVSAQTTISGGLAGVITDPRGAVVPSVNVDIRDVSKGSVQSTQTDQQGVYRFFFLLPGRYSLSAKRAGFREETLVIDVPLGPPVSVNVTLDLETVKAEITVSDQAASISAENGDVSATIGQLQVAELPNPGNDLTYVVQTTPGVVMNTDIAGVANFSILGMPGDSYLHTMDGMNDNDIGLNLSLVGPLNLLLGQNQVQEATVVSTGYSGQFGGAAGGNVNYVTKSGGNALHGNAQYYWNGRALNANDWLSKAFGNPRPFSIANQWAGALGGPIKKDQLFFFFDTEGLRLIIPQQSFVTIPSAAFEAITLDNITSRFGQNSASSNFYRKMFDLYNSAPGVASAQPGGFNQQSDPLGCSGFIGQGGVGSSEPCAVHFITSRSRPSQDALISERTDWNVTAQDRAFFRLQYDRGRAVRSTDAISPLFDTDYSMSWWQGQILETHTFGSSGANQVLLAGSYVHPIYGVQNLADAMSALPTTLSFTQGPFNNLGSTANFHGHIAQTQIGDDFFRSVGSHKFGFGGSLAMTRWNRSANLAPTAGQLYVQTLQAYYDGGFDPATPDTDFTALSQSFTSETRLRDDFLNFGLYAEDEWRAKPNLIFTVALRLEHYGNPTCRDHCFARLAEPFTTQTHDPSEPYNRAILANQSHAFASTDPVLWSPRFSFAWRPFAESIVIRGGAGIFYDPLPGLIVDLFSNNPPLYNTYFVQGNNLSPGETTSLFSDASAANRAFVNGFKSGQNLAEIEASIPQYSPPAINSPERTMHSPQYQRWSLEFEKSFRTNTTISMGYHGHHGIHGLVEDPDANAFGFGSLPAAPCTVSPAAPCTDPRFSGVTRISTIAVSNYHGLVASAQHRFRSKGLVEANYTYGHALNESGGFGTFTTVGLMAPQDPNNLRGSYGPADFDVRHSFNASYVWNLPFNSTHGWSSVISGWQISGTFFARTGFPYTVFDFEQSGSLVGKNYFGLLYAVPGGPLGADSPCGKGAAVPVVSTPCQPPQLTAQGTPNSNARFLQSGCLTDFNSGHRPAQSGPCDGALITYAQGRNHFRGPSYFNTDFSITKSTRLRGWECATFRLGAQFFNVLNHPNFGFPDPGLSSPTFGYIMSLEQPPTSLLGSGLGTTASPRMIQIKAELQF